MTAFLEFMLGHHAAEWIEGNLTFGVQLHFAVVIGGLAAIVGAVWIFYRKTPVAAGSRLKVILIALRSMVLATLVVCLLQPSLIISWPVAQLSDIAVLVDDSRSMTVQDMGNGRSRGDAAIDLLYGANGLAEHLRKDFRLHTRTGTPV